MYPSCFPRGSMSIIVGYPNVLVDGSVTICGLHIVCKRKKCSLLVVILSCYLWWFLIGIGLKLIIISHREIWSTSSAIFMRPRKRSTSSSDVPSIMRLEVVFTVILGSLKTCSPLSSNFQTRDAWLYTWGRPLVLDLTHFGQPRLDWTPLGQSFISFLCSQRT